MTSVEDDISQWLKWVKGPEVTHSTSGRRQEYVLLASPALRSSSRYALLLLAERGSALPSQSCTRCGRTRRELPSPRARSTTSGTGDMTTGCWRELLRILELVVRALAAVDREATREAGPPRGDGEVISMSKIFVFTLI